jgi:hypothetical protein
MSIREEIGNIEINQIVINNIEQLSRGLKLLVLETKDEILQNFGYVPKISECLFLIFNNDIPHKCSHPNCDNIALFNKGKYGYCSKKCRDINPIRNSKIQEKRKGKIDYHKMNLKSAKTRGETIDTETGLNGHQLAGKRAVETREFIYDWSKLTSDAQAEVSKEDRDIRIKKRQRTIEDKYGVSHFGGGASRLKDVEIFGKKYKVQGYEDVAIYELIESGISPDDITVINQHKEYAIEYKFNDKIFRYFPDLMISSLNKFIEVKSDYWYYKEQSKCESKIAAAKSSGINYELIIYFKEEKNEIRRIRKNIKRIIEKEK